MAGDGVVLQDLDKRLRTGDRQPEHCQGQACAQYRRRYRPWKHRVLLSVTQ
jgi:hypothetical protein